MLFSTVTKIVALLAISSQAALAASTATGTKDVKQQALTAHNKYRSKHHVPAVKWNQKLADHATKVTKTCVWGHSVMAGTGQNIAYGYSSMTAVVDAWYKEVSNYNYNTGKPKTAGKVTGHFTQVVWKKTTEIGCGATYCPNLGGTYYVCDYSPPGNYNNEYVANVLKP